MFFINIENYFFRFKQPKIKWLCWMVVPDSTTLRVVRWQEWIPLLTPLLKNVNLQQPKIVLMLIKNTMDKPIPSSDLIGYIIELEQFESTTLEDQVIQKAENAGFLNVHDESYIPKLCWIKKIVKHAEDAFNLEAVIDSEQPLELNMSTFKQLRQEREKRVNDILELLARYIIDAAPPYKG